MRIPVRNVFFLLSYAWNALDEGTLTKVRQSDPKDLTNLFALILDSGLRHTIRRGLYREYAEATDVIPGVRGRIALSGTLRRGLDSIGKAECVFDELTHDVEHNRILRTTLRLVMSSPTLQPELHDRLGALYRRLGEVAHTNLRKSSFRKTNLHRGNHAYRLLLQVCEFVLDGTLVEEGGELTFRDFVRDERRMADLFQRFVLNFYKREQSVFLAHSPYIRWHGHGITANDSAHLPIMKTDVVLEADGHAIIIDTKYYLRALESRFGQRKVRSEHLYQIFSYLQNFRAGRRDALSVSGMLLYPNVDEPFDLQYNVDGSRIRVASVDLALDWTDIHDQLLARISDL